MFQVEIKNLKTKAHIGITQMERKKSQPLLVTFRFQYTLTNKNQIDNIKYLKDYSLFHKSGLIGSCAGFMQTFVDAPLENIKIQKMYYNKVNFTPT